MNLKVSKKNKQKPKISILTTSWNREKYLKKLAMSLKKQSFKNFEWIISNDGSEDNTHQFIKNFSKKVNFRIIYINSSIRIGKAKLMNLMMKKISGKYTIECDSDDYFLPNSLNFFFKTINNKKYKKIKNFSGVVAQNISTDGVSQTFKRKIPQNFEIVEWKNLEKKIDGDATIMALSSNYRNRKYMEVDFLINESSLINKIFKNKKFLLTPKVVKIMDRKAENSVSFGNKLQYTRASTYCIAMNETHKKFNKKNIFKKIKIIINYWRYSLHGDISLKKSIQMFSSIKKNYFYLILYPFSFIIFLRDYMLGKVEKTHIQFYKNIKKVKTSTFIFNNGGQ